MEGIGDALDCSAATAIYLYRATADIAGDEDLWRWLQAT